jgi:trk system potassium uptake protein TrkA
MNVVIMGCGRVGEQLSTLLLSDGHQVTVIDLNPQALDRLGAGRGRRTDSRSGVLIQAGLRLPMLRRYQLTR